MDVIYRYLDCGDLHFGFARVKCAECGHEYLLAYSCKRRHFCPSCHQKRVVEFGERLCAEVLKYVPHRQWVFSIPKRLRVYFMFDDRRLFTRLSRCAWKVLRLYLTQAAACDDAQPGAAIAVQSFAIFRSSIRICMLFPPMAASTMTTHSRSAHCQIKLSWKHCSAMKCSKCSKKKVKLSMLSSKT